MGQRRRVKPGDRDHRRGIIGEYFLEWGQGEVLEEALPEGRRQTVRTRPPRDGERNGVVVLKPEHLQSPLQLSVDTRDRMLPVFVRDDPCALIGHVLGYRAIVRRTQAFLQDTPNGDQVPIDKVPGMNFTSGARYKIRELIEVVEVDERDPAQFEDFARPAAPVVEQDPATWPEPTTGMLDGDFDRQHASFGLVASGNPVPISSKVHGLRVADRALKAILDRGRADYYTAENFAAWRQVVFSVISRVLRQIEGRFDDPREAFLAACDLTEGALLLYSRSWPFPLTEERQTEYERVLTDQATSDFELVSGWRVS